MEEKIILEKIDLLPELTKRKLSSQLVFDVIGALEKKFAVKLFMVLARLVVGDVLPKDLVSRLAADLKLSPKDIKEIADRLVWLLTDLNAVGGLVDASPAEKGRAEFLFSTEDEADVAQFKKFLTGRRKEYDYESLADLIIFESGYKTQDEVMNKRLFGIVVSRLKDIRDDLETSNVLAKSRKIGGMELTEIQIDRLLELIKDKVDRGFLKEKKKPIVPDQIIEPMTVRSPVKDATQIKKKIETAHVRLKTDLALMATKAVPSALGLYALKNQAVEKTPPVLAIKEEDGLPVIESLMPDGHVVAPTAVPRVAGGPVLTPKPFRSAPAAKMSAGPASRKPRLDEIRVAPKIMGPVEELENMTLIDFRRLSDTAKGAVDKIKEKVGLLEIDSYGQKLAGIEAWQKSEVARFYRFLGRESLKSGRGVGDVIRERMETRKPTLSLEEFEAIMSLNKDLRY